MFGSKICNRFPKAYMTQKIVKIAMSRNKVLLFGLFNFIFSGFCLIAATLTVEVLPVARKSGMNGFDAWLFS